MTQKEQRPFICAKAPLRVSFSGGGTDIAPYCDEFGCVVLSTSINKYSLISLAPRKDREVNLHSFDFGNAVNIKFNLDQKPVYNGMLDLAKAVIEEMALDTGFDVYMYTDAPPASGLGTSSTFTVAMLGALHEYAHLTQDSYAIAERAHEIERIKLQYTGGRQDQYAAAFGGFNLIEFHRHNTVVTPLRISRKILQDIESHMLLCYTGKTHYSSDLIRQQIRYYEEKRLDTLSGLHELKRITYEMKDVLVHGDIYTFAKMIDESGELKKRINPNAIPPVIEEMYQTALAAGALGGKLLGAGGGGFLLLFCPIMRRHDVMKALTRLGGSFMQANCEEFGMKTWRSQWS